jgi:hypothetical protein
MVDKVIISNRSALEAKYGNAGSKAVGAALKALIAADKKRGLKTVIVEIDDQARMKALRGKVPLNAKDQRGAKLAVDAVATALTPDYIVLLDGPDVIPHIVLENPVPADGDTGIESDLPYASPAPFSRQAANFLAVTRVVGRIPNVPGAKDPKRLLAAIATAVKAKPSKPEAYRAYFGISAEVWSASTAMSLDEIFSGHGDLRLSPPAGPPKTNALFGRLSHFINCHGAPGKPEFYGQRGEVYPVAVNSAQIAAKAKPGTIVAAECCYGAALYDPALLGVDDPIPVAYLSRGALGFVGSTNIAYGPADSNDQADLITRYFIQHVTSGASLGRGFLQARQRFVANSTMTDPTQLKTLAQFLLLGDPSVVACAATKQYSATKGIAAAASPADEVSQRKARRVVLASAGLSIAGAKAVPQKKGKVPPAVRARVLAIAKERGLGDGTPTMLGVRAAPNYAAASKARALKESVMVVSKRKDAPNGIVVVRHLVAHIVDKGIASVVEVVSR